ncbi:MAG: citrate:proton symporter [Desulfarculus sp.]|nr:citrate:proton symporter [Desulfarculus sp.]
MLALFGLLTILVLLAAIISKRMSPLVALVMIPLAAVLLQGFGLKAGVFAVDGLKNIAPVVTMFVFAILFFGTVSDAGMFDPVINGILKVVKGDPVRIVVGSAVLGIVMHLDGSGASTFLLAIPPMLPLYERLNMDKRVLACVVALAAGTMNIVPWGGPTLRAASALHLPVTELYNPVVVPQLCGLVFVLVVAWWLGRREKKRLGEACLEGRGAVYCRELSEAELALRRPKLLWFNALLTLAVVGTLLWGKVSPAILFMVGATVALLVNYPKIADQRARVDAHAKAALMMASILLAAGVFLGVMNGSGMIKAMAQASVDFIPASLATHIPVVLAVLSMPLSIIFDPDSFYFGVLPIVAGVVKELGLNPITVGQAAILGQMTTGFPLSPLTPATFLLMGLTGVDLGEHQKFTFVFAFLTTIVMTLVALMIGLFPL